MAPFCFLRFGDSSYREVVSFSPTAQEYNLRSFRVDEARERVPLRALRILGLHPVAGRDAGGDLRGGVALELDGVGPGRARRLDELVAELHVAVVVDPRLRDHVAGMPLAHPPPVDRELALHALTDLTQRSQRTRRERKVGPNGLNELPFPLRASAVSALKSKASLFGPRCRRRGRPSGGWRPCGAGAR